MTAQKGVIYYKLDPQFHYENDVTLNCGLTGGDIDGNFNFLRGYDIKTFEVSEDKRELTVVRHNGEKLAVNIYDPQFYHFEYDKSKRLDEQNLMPKTKGVLALLYRDYIANETKREEFIYYYNSFLEEKQKNQIYKFSFFFSVLV